MVSIGTLIEKCVCFQKTLNVCRAQLLFSRTLYQLRDLLYPRPIHQLERANQSLNSFRIQTAQCFILVNHLYPERSYASKVSTGALIGEGACYRKSHNVLRALHPFSQTHQYIERQLFHRYNPHQKHHPQQLHQQERANQALISCHIQTVQCFIHVLEVIRTNYYVHQVYILTLMHKYAYLPKSLDVSRALLPLSPMQLLPIHHPRQLQNYHPQQIHQLERAKQYLIFFLIQTVQCFILASAVCQRNSIVQTVCTGTLISNGVCFRNSQNVWRAMLPFSPIPTHLRIGRHLPHLKHQFPLNRGQGLQQPNQPQRNLWSQQPKLHRVSHETIAPM